MEKRIEGWNNGMMEYWNAGILGLEIKYV